MKDLHLLLLAGLGAWFFLRKDKPPAQLSPAVVCRTGDPSELAEQIASGACRVVYTKPGGSGVDWAELAGSSPANWVEGFPSPQRSS